MVWAVDAKRAPDYWFPRQFPRALAWVTSSTTPADRERILSPGRTRVHAIEYGWLAEIRSVELFAYRLPAAAFRPVDDDDDPHAFVAITAVDPLGPAERVGDLLALHDEAGIELRPRQPVGVLGRRRRIEPAFQRHPAAQRPPAPR